jgi:hypothetical protein
VFEKHKREKAAKAYSEALLVWTEEQRTLRGWLDLVLNGGGPGAADLMKCH